MPITEAFFSHNNLSLLLLCVYDALKISYTIQPIYYSNLFSSLHEHNILTVADTVDSEKFVEFFMHSNNKDYVLYNW